MLGKHSGRHAFRDRVVELGFELDEFELNRTFLEFKKLADRKKDMFDADIEALILNAEGSAGGPWTMKTFAVSSGTDQGAEASITLLDEEASEKSATASGDGPIAAALSALETITSMQLTLKNFDLRSISMGEDAQGEVVVTVEYNDNLYRGHGVSTDIVEAGTRAYLEVINRILRRKAAGIADGDASKAGHQATI